MSHLIPRAWMLLALAVLAGCTRYEYQVLEPADPPLRVGREEAQALELDPLSYQLRTVDDYLVMRIYNPTAEPIQLVGDASFAVDPRGQSHPLPTLTIAPESYGRLILPPPPQRIERRGPSFGIGVGVGISSAHPHRRPFHDPVLDPPRYYYVYDDNNPQYWRWPVGGTVRLNLAYQTGEREFRHQFVIRRVKAE